MSNTTIAIKEILRMTESERTEFFKFLEERNGAKVTKEVKALVEVGSWFRK